MDVFLKMRRRSRRRGQTIIEWLLLMTLCFIIGYFVITRPVAIGTRAMLATLASSLANVVQNGSITFTSQAAGPTDSNFPGSVQHQKPLHL